MTDLSSLLAPRSVAIAGLSADSTKHGQRVLNNMRRLGYAGQIWGVNPNLPQLDGVDVVGSIAELPEVPDVIVSAVPARAVGNLALEAGRLGVDTVIVFAGGFAEAGEQGRSLQDELVAASRETSVRILGPNSGGVIVPSQGVAMSFLTCLDRPPSQIRSGPVGLVTQSGGMGSYVHNLAAAAGDGLAASISTGNEADLGVADGILALVAMPGVKAISVILETVRNGPAFVEALAAANEAGIPVVITRIGKSPRGRRLMTTHTGALAQPERVTQGVLDEFGVTVAETPAEMFEVASILARTPKLSGPRVGIVTHSGGVAIMLSDLAEGTTIELPQPSPSLRSTLEPLLQQGAVDNPLDMGGIIGGAHRFGEVVAAVARSGDVDAVLAVSSAHPPAHSEERVASLLDQDLDVPVINLWMAGDVGVSALEMLRRAHQPVTEEPRAVIRAIAALTRPARGIADPDVGNADPMPSAPLTEFAAKQIVASWGVPVVEGRHVATADTAAGAADALGYPVVVKVSTPDVQHKTEFGGVAVNLASRNAVETAFERVQSTLPEGTSVEGVLVEKHLDGPEVIIGGLRDETFGPMILVGVGGVVAEALDDVRVAPAPLTVESARRIISNLSGLRVLTNPRSSMPADLDALAAIVADVSRHFVRNTWLQSFDLNPVVWNASTWVALDAMLEVTPRDSCGC